MCSVTDDPTMHDATHCRHGEPIESASEWCIAEDPRFAHHYDPRPGDTWCQHCNSALGGAPHDSEDDVWLAHLFADEYCAECGGDAQHHTVVSFLGNPFARCDYPPDAVGNYHPTIAAFRDIQPATEYALDGPDIA